MVAFSNCKINIGLDILRRRPDGYHDIATAMVPVPWHDVIEIIPKAEGESTLTVLGNAVDCPPEKNLVMKAYQALNVLIGLPPVDIILQKIIPDGAGLGGGSGDAASTLLILNDLFNLGLSKEQLAGIAAGLGADCPFFIYNRPMMCTGTGTTMHEIDLDVSAYKILIAKPNGVSVSTRDAYANCHPHQPEVSLEERLTLPVDMWQSTIVNDFQAGVVALAPAVGIAIEKMLSAGAVYAAMSGSGAAVFGLFENDKLTEAAAAELVDCTLFKA